VLVFDGSLALLQGKKHKVWVDASYATTAAYLRMPDPAQSAPATSRSVTQQRPRRPRWEIV
jgi:hypothetical protein